MSKKDVGNFNDSGVESNLPEKFNQDPEKVDGLAARKKKALACHTISQLKDELARRDAEGLKDCTDEEIAAAIEEKKNKRPE